jgi:hypothetical protein
MKTIVRNLISLIALIIILNFLFITGCKEDSVSSGDCPASQRTGAVCNDGSSSSATGSGACSGHGGVKYWLCN